MKPSKIMKTAKTARFASASVLALAGFAIAGSTSAGEVMAPACGFATNYVASGVVDVQSARVLAADGGTIYKQGGGTWSLPLSYLAQPWAASFGVMDGTLSFGLGAQSGSYTAPTTLPASISGKALIWVDANDDANVVREGNAVSAWYDHREGDIANPQYVRASTHTGYTTDAPEYATVNGGAKAVYFGGYASGRTMKFVNPNGSDCTSHTSADAAVKQVFAVICNSNSYGNVFGSYSSTYSPFRIGNETSAGGSLRHYFYSAGDGNQESLNEKMIHGRAYLNGMRIDPTATKVEKGLQLLEAEAKVLTGNSLVSGFFAGNVKAYSGGDYLCEAIAFTNRLTEAERLVVEEYLMAKWLSQGGRRLKSVRLADGGLLSENVGAGESVETQLALSGTGTAEKTGDGDLVLRNSTESSGVEWDVKGGSLTLGAFAPVKVAAGKNVTVDNLVEGPKVTMASGSADSLVKNGSDMLAVNGMPSGVTYVRVAGGTLAVRAPRTDSIPSESAYEVPLRNGSFEEYADVIAGTQDDGGRIESLANMKNLGWNRWAGAAYVFDYDGWTTGNGAIGGTRSAFNITSRPPDGRCALLMRCSSSDNCQVAYGTFELGAGDYELRFKMCGRQSVNFLGGKFSASMRNDTATVRKYGLRYTYMDGYLEYSLRFPSLVASDKYRIVLELASGFDGAVVIDDVHLYKVPADPLAAAKWKVPGGDFEASTVPTAAASQTFSAANTLSGSGWTWTFTQPAGWTLSLPAVGVSTLAMTNSEFATRGVLYNNSREPESGSMQLCFLGTNGVAETSITPPAGTYRLEGFLSKFGSYAKTHAISATIIRQNAEEVALGQLTPGNKMMKRLGWPNSFTVDGSETVTLRLEVSSSSADPRVNRGAAGILLDDIELVKATDLELFRNGDCETNLDSIDSSAFGCPAGKVLYRTDTEAPEAFGSEMVDGHRMVAIGNLSYLYQDVALPFAGRYRLSFYAKSRPTGKTGAYGPNPLDVTVSSGDATNMLGRVNTYNSEWTQRVFDFTVPSGGVYRVAFQGVDSPDGDAAHEAHVDSISLRQVHETHDLTPPFDEETRIDVAEGARLETDFAGTNTIRRLKLGSVHCKGVVHAADYPEYLSGNGAFRIVPSGMVISYR